MLKQVLTVSSLLVLLAFHLPTEAQAQVSVPKPPEKQASQTQISPQELQKFASAVKQLLVIKRAANQQMRQVVQQEGLSEARFMEIAQAQQTPAQSTKPISPEEKQKFNQALSKMKDIQQQMQPKMKKAVQDQGLELQRFNQIMAAVQQSPDLRQQVQKLIQSRGGFETRPYSYLSLHRAA